MAYIITRLCTDCLDKGCVEVCPVECIYQPVDPAGDALPNMLFIHPSECISCAACEAECPWQAIFEDRELPPAYAEDQALNAVAEQRRARFSVARVDRDAAGRIVRPRRPTADQLERNRARWRNE